MGRELQPGEAKTDKGEKMMVQGNPRLILSDLRFPCGRSIVVKEGKEISDNHNSNIRLCCRVQVLSTSPL